MSTDARLAQLEATVEDLRRELERQRTQRRLPMRQTHRCPACGGGRVLQVTLVEDMTGGVASVPLSLVKEHPLFGTKHLGPLEAFVCRSCMLVEWHATSLGGVAPDGKIVIEHDAVVEADPDAGPYR